MNRPAPAIVPAALHTARFAGAIADLVHATGPVSYDYQFGPDRRLLDLVVAGSWSAPRTLYAAENATLALSADDLAGIEIGFHGPDFIGFKDNLGGVAAHLIGQNAATADEFAGLLARAARAAWLNPAIPKDAYYILALATTPASRGAGVGAALLRGAVTRARDAGYRSVHLDVLADNPAVAFYRAFGFEIVAETSVPDLVRDHAFPSEYRMVLELT